MQQINIEEIDAQERQPENISSIGIIEIWSRYR